MNFDAMSTHRVNGEHFRLGWFKNYSVWESSKWLLSSDDFGPECYEARDGHMYTIKIV